MTQLNKDKPEDNIGGTSTPSDDTANDRDFFTGTMNEDSFKEFPWKPVPDSKIGAKYVTITLANGFGTYIRTQPALTNQYKVDIYTAIVIAENSQGKPEILANWEPYEYLFDSAVLILLSELESMDCIDHETEGHLFISHPSNSGTSSSLPWYDLAGKLSVFVAGVVAGIAVMLDKIGSDKGDDDDDTW